MYILKELSVHISSTQRNNTLDYSDIWHFFTQNANFCGKYLIVAEVQRKNHLWSSLKQIFQRSVVRTWVQAVFRQKNRPLISWRASSAYQAPLVNILPWTKHWGQKHIWLPFFPTKTFVNSCRNISSWCTKTHKKYHCTGH